MSRLKGEAEHCYFLKECPKCNEVVSYKDEIIITKFVNLLDEPSSGERCYAEDDTLTLKKAILIF